jgi:hypothetical protein
MAHDWLKMRGNLFTHPKVIRIAKMLEADPAIGSQLSNGFRGALREIVTRDVTRDVTVASLMRVWCAANEHTHDGVWRGIDLDDLDHVAGLVGFGRMMEAVGWAVYDADEQMVTLPNFLKFNVPAKAGVRSGPAERQKRYRQKKESASVNNVTLPVTRDVTRDVTRVTRVEKSREENSSGGGPSSPGVGPARDAQSPGTPGEPPPRRDKIVEPSDFPELQARFPLVDIERERNKALDYVRRERGPSAELELRFFAAEWLPKAPARSESKQAQIEAQSDGPQGWREWFQEVFPLAEYPDRTPYHEGPWSKFPTTLRERFKAERGRPVAQSA